MDLAELVRQGDRNVRAHDVPADLASSARAFLDCVAGWDAFTVEAASPAAERVLGAAMMLSPNLHAGRSSRTVILDVNISSGTLVANAARRIRDTTQAEWLIAVVLNSLTQTDMRWSIDGVDSLFVCNPSIRGRESSERAEDGLGIRAG